jgi:uncharacterized membrane protein YqjE
VNAGAAEPGTPPRSALREAISVAASAVVTRGELAAVELAEARRRVAWWIALALAAAVTLLAALLVASLLVVSIFWDTHRTAAIASVAFAYAVAGAALAASFAAAVRSAPPLLQATLAELRRDCEALCGSSNRGSG